MKYNYIDAEKLKTGIRRRIKELDNDKYLSTHGKTSRIAELHCIDRFIDSLQQEQSECIYGRTLEERKKYCKFCSAICEARIEQKPAERNEEDERIRKEIVSIIEQYGRICEKEGDPCLELCDCLAWLEKQKEQKPVGDKVSEEWNELQADFKRINEAFEDGKNEVINRPEAFGLQKPAEEGEDERIRKEMTMALTNCLDELIENNGWNYVYVNNKNIPINEVKKWLEKQKEQEPSEQKYEGEKLHDIVIAELGKYNGDNFFKAPWAIDSTGLQYPLYFANLGAKWQKEQKPAEWSKEDEEMLKDIIRSVNGFDAVTGIIPQRFEQHEKKINWLEHLPERFNLQPKQEWSEEDEEYLAACIEAIDNFYTLSGELKTLTKINVLRKEYAEKLKSWLKSLSERFNLLPKQEWNEEDILNLDNIIWLCENCEKGIETTWIPSQATKIKYLMKSIKEGPAQKQEWSEEDENMFEKCISRMTNIIPVTGKSGGIKDMTFETRTEMELVNWLKKKLNR